MNQHPTATKPIARRPSGALVELDVFRGIAAVLMIINHTGNELLVRSGGSVQPATLLVFAGSFAPALFFLATGFGIALSSTKKEPDAWISTVWKAAILVLADQLFWWNDGTRLRLDFFSFIAIATLLITPLSRLRKSVSIAIALLVCAIATRYILMPTFGHLISANGLIAWIAGTPGIERISYPFSPWIVYPLGGYIMGRIFLQQQGKRNTHIFISSILIIAAGAISILLYQKHKVFFRWGTVSFSYFALSLFVVGISGYLAILLAKCHHSIRSAISLRGVASFLVIPLHYALIHYAKGSINTPKTLPEFIFTATSIIVLSFACAKLFDRILNRMNSTGMRNIYGAIFLVIFMTSLVTTAFYSHDSKPDLAAAILLIGQLALGGLLLYRFR